MLPPIESRGVEVRVRHEIRGDETVGEAIVAALREAGIDPGPRDSVMQDWIDVDGIRQLLQSESRSGDVRVIAELWETPVAVTRDQVVVSTTNTRG
jgi:hypothetical protein